MAVHVVEASVESVYRFACLSLIWPDYPGYWLICPAHAFIASHGFLRQHPASPLCHRSLPLHSRLVIAPLCAQLLWLPNNAQTPGRLCYSTIARPRKCWLHTSRDTPAPEFSLWLPSSPVSRFLFPNSLCRITA